MGKAISIKHSNVSFPSSFQEKSNFPKGGPSVLIWMLIIQAGGIILTKRFASLVLCQYLDL